MGFDTVERYDTEDPEYPGTLRANIVARKKGKKKGTVWFVTHMDTVPPGDLDDWENPPFQPVVKDGRIYGRGTEDNGQSLIGVAVASNVITQLPFEGMSLGVAFVGDEESGSVCGVKHLIDSGVFSKDDFIIVPDWGAPGGAMVDVSEKQIMWVKVAVTGKQTHGSTPDKGINAYRASIEFMSDLLSRLEQRYPDSDPIFRPDRSTFEPTKASANCGSVNMIPGYYEMYMDCRVILKYDIREIFSFMESVAKEHSERTGANFELTLVQGAVSGKKSDTDTMTIFEPSKNAVFEKILKYNVAIQVHQAALESMASEQSSRMTAMDSATRNADELISRMSIKYNRMRQSMITLELVEVISGAEALNNN
jgi:succinyl-diaminopimelate desuccinylase